MHRAPRWRLQSFTYLTHASSQVEALAQELAQTDLAHVRVLRDILGNNAAPMPAMDIGNSWSVVANAALNTQLQPAFDPYANGALAVHRHLQLHCR